MGRSIPESRPNIPTGDSTPDGIRQLPMRGKVNTVFEVTTPVLDENVRAFLAQPLNAYLTLIDRDGFPHTLPLWYDVDGADLVMSSHCHAVDVEAVAANSRVAVTVGANRCDETGYVLKGELSVEADPDGVWFQRIASRYEDWAQVEKDVQQACAVVVRLTVQSVTQVE